MDSFGPFNLNTKILKGIEAVGFSIPTPIQEKAIPSVMDGRDVMGLAQTGTGKTAAFGLPILNRLMEGRQGQIRALIIAPTRELAEQIHQSMGTYGSHTRLRSVTIYGGISMNLQIQKLKRGADIVVACPGRLLDHIRQRTINLNQLEVLVLDEADHMFDMGFLPDIRKILQCLPKKRQTLLFSATMPSVIKKLAKDILIDPVTIQIGNTAVAVTVNHSLYPVAQQHKTRLLQELLHKTDTESVLIFARTKHRAQRLSEQLVKSGYKAVSLQGNLSQNRRQAALNGFRRGTFQILVATDIAARGIDVSKISHVINYDMPDTPEAYIHRIGRTGRAARSGDAFTLVTAEDKSKVFTIERVLGFQLERCTIDNFDYNPPGQKPSQEFSRPPRQQTYRRNGAGGKMISRQKKVARPSRMKASSFAR